MRRRTGHIVGIGRSLWFWSIGTVILTPVFSVRTLGDDTPPVVFIPPASGSRYCLTINYGGQDRIYVVHVPPCYDGVTPLPVVVALHGVGGDAASFLDETNWAACANRNGFIVMAPEGLPFHAPMPAASLANPRVWNSGQYPSLYPHSHIDDSGFIVAAVDDMSARWRVDSRRVYASGYSNGGAMVFRLAAEHGDRFTAIASFSGRCWLSDPRPCRAMPTLFVVGTLDPILPIHGGLKVLPWEIQPSRPVRTVMAEWAAAVGCPTTPHSAGQVPGYHVNVEDYGPGQSGGLLRVMYVRGQGHGWPGGHSLRPERLLGPDLSHFNATGAMWEFFQQWSW
jgi:polyhydroxybutyrate depolymerase